MTARQTPCMRPGSRPPDSPRAFPPRPPVAGRRRRGRGRRLGLGTCLIRLLPGVTVSAGRADRRQLHQRHRGHRGLHRGRRRAAPGQPGPQAPEDGEEPLRSRAGDPPPLASRLQRRCQGTRPHRQDHPACHPAPVAGGQDRPGPGTEPALVSGPQALRRRRAVPAGLRGG